MQESLLVGRSLGSLLDGRSDAFDSDALGVRREGFKVARIGRENGPAGFGDRDDQRVDGGAATSMSAQKCCTSCERLAELFHDVAGLEELVRDGVATGVSLKALHENDRRNRRRP